MSQKPSVGRIVHYVSYGTPGGEYTQECRAAIVTEVPPDADGLQTLGLCVLNPTGQFFNRAVPFDDGGETPGKPNCPDAATHGTPFRYCGCGWAEAQTKGGTWHWPERTES
jgi:hypothetical protein